MQNQITERLGKAKFRIQWENLPNSSILMDFNPLIEQFKLKGNYALFHWQAKPFGLRRWGLYFSPHDYYYPFDYNDLEINERVNLTFLQLDETRWGVKPTAVLLVEDISVLSIKERRIV